MYSTIHLQIPNPQFCALNRRKKKAKNFNIAYIEKKSKMTNSKEPKKTLAAAISCQTK